MLAAGAVILTATHEECVTYCHMAITGNSPRSRKRSLVFSSDLRGRLTIGHLADGATAFLERLNLKE
jgi:hypothetical protein